MDSELLVGLHTELPDIGDGNRLGRGVTMVPDPMRRRIVPVLDSIADVLVSKPSGQIIATGMQIDQKKNEIILTIACNGPFDGTTCDHLEDIWTRLQNLADAYHKNRLSQKGEEYVKMAEGIASKSSEQDTNSIPPELMPQILDFEKTIYVFSLKRFSQRIHKRFRKNSTRLQEFCKLVYDAKDNGKAVTKHLLLIGGGLEWISERLLEDGLDDEERVCDKFLDYMSGIRLKIETILKDDVLQNELSFIGSSSDFPMLRYLRKVASLPYAINTLLSFPHFARLRQQYLLGKILRISVPCTLHREISLPQSLEGWNEVAHRAADKLKWELPGNLQVQPGHQVAERFKGNEEVRAPVHCECVIALHLIKRYVAEPPPISYIGVSKLSSCLACWFFLKSLSENGFNMVTKGGHGKAYFPWKYPDQEIRDTELPRSACTNISNSFLSSMSNSYINRLQAEHSRRLLSESGSSNQNHFRKTKYFIEDLI